MQSRTECKEPWYELWSTRDRRTPETAGKVSYNIIVDLCDWQSVLASVYKKSLLWKLWGTPLHECLTLCSDIGSEETAFCFRTKLPPRARNRMETRCLSPLPCTLSLERYPWQVSADVCITEWKTFPLTVCHSLGLLSKLNPIVSHCLWYVLSYC